MPAPRAPLPPPLPGTRRERWADRRADRKAPVKEIQPRREEDSALAAAQRGANPLVEPQLRTHRSSAGAGSVVVIGLVIAFVALVPLVAYLQGMTDNGESIGFHRGRPIIRWAIVIGTAAMAVIAWRRRWRIVDTPTVEVAGVHPGMCELTAKVHTERPVVSWATSTPCIAYVATIKERRGKNPATIWQYGEMADSAVLDDGTGRVHVEVDRVRKTMRQIHKENLSSNRAYSEMALVDGDELYVLATVRIDPDGSLIARRNPVIGEPGGDRLPRVFHAKFGDERRARNASLITGIVTTAISIATAVSLVVLETWTRTRRGSDGKNHTEIRLVERVSEPLSVAAITAGIIAVVLLVAYVIRWLNRLIALRNEVDYAESFIDTTVQQRHDLINQLVPGVVEAARHETTVMTASARVRADAPNRALVNARIEQNPNLTTDAVFANLFAELVRSENRVAAARRYYNDAVTLCRDRASQFPAIVVAKAVFRRGMPDVLDFDIAVDAPPPSMSL